MTEIDRRAELAERVAKKGKPLHAYALGMEHRKFGDDTAALAAFAQTLELDAYYHPALFMAAQIHVDHDALEDAKAALFKGIAIAERTGDGHAANEMRAMLDEL